MGRREKGAAFPRCSQVRGSAPQTGRETTRVESCPSGSSIAPPERLSAQRGIAPWPAGHLDCQPRPLRHLLPVYQTPIAMGSSARPFQSCPQRLVCRQRSNIFEPFSLNDFADIAALDAAPAVTRQAASLNAIAQAKGGRSLLSPAEPVNSLTVVALHVDGAEASSLPAMANFRDDEPTSL